MEKYKVLISGINTSDLVTLSVQEMKGLFERYKAGDLFARDLLIEGNLSLIIVIGVSSRLKYKPDCDNWNLVYPKVSSK